MTSDLFKCYICDVDYKEKNFLFNHYKTDWHSYNLKQREVNLLPLTFENFVTEHNLKQDKNIFEINNILENEGMVNNDFIQKNVDSEVTIFSNI
jgi:hypothetical protein